MTLEKLNLGTGVLLAAFAFNACSDDNSATAGPDTETRAECTAQKLPNDYDSIFEFTCDGKIAGSTENGFCKLENSGAGSANKTVICGEDTVGVFYGTLEDTAKCTEGDIFQQANTSQKYVCLNETWKAADSLDELTLQVYETYGIACNESNKGEIIKGKITDRDFVCQANGAWGTPTELDYETKGKKCDEENDGEITKFLISTAPYKYSYYRCVNGSWTKSSQLEYDTQNKTCDESNEGEVIKVIYDYALHMPQGNYICKQGIWENASILERDTYKMKCDSSNLGEITEGNETQTSYKCTESGWKELASSVFWTGHDDDNYRVKTGLNCENGESGKWLLYSDNSLGGNSNIEWPTEPGNAFDDKALDPIIEECGGICGTFILGDNFPLNDGDTTYTVKPFVGVQFSITNSDTVGGDITDWGGISISYKADAPMFIELVPENEKEFLEANNYFKMIPRSSYNKYVQIPWSKFNPWPKKNAISQKEFLKKVVAIRIYIEQEPGRNVDFGIYFIGTYNASPYLTSMDACPNG